MDNPPDSSNTRCPRVAVAVAIAVAATVAGAEPAWASPAHRMLLLPNMHTCDFQPVTSQFGRAGATPFADITFDGQTAIAHLNMTQGADNAQYVVRMIPAPHAVPGCAAGDPGITTGLLSTDDFGTGSVTLQAPLARFTTGVWLAVDLPSVHSQMPQEFYSSNYIASV